jgi:hypothetical protein
MNREPKDTSIPTLSRELGAKTSMEAAAKRAWNQEKFTPPREGNRCACRPWMAEDKSKQINRYLGGRLGEQRRSCHWGRTAWRPLQGAAPDQKEVVPGGLTWATRGHSRGIACRRRKNYGAGDREKKKQIIFFINRWHLRVITPKLHN